MTTEMPPSAMVDVNVVVTFFDETGVLVLLVAEATVGVALDVSRVVPFDVAWAAKQVSKVSPCFRDACKLLAAAPTFYSIKSIYGMRQAYMICDKGDNTEAWRLFPGTVTMTSACHRL